MPFFFSFFFFPMGVWIIISTLVKFPTARHAISVWRPAGDLSNCVPRERGFAVQFTHYAFILRVYETKPPAFHPKRFKPHTNNNIFFFWRGTGAGRLKQRKKFFVDIKPTHLTP